MIIQEAIDYSLYLVTGRDLLPPGKDYSESLEQSLQGGVSIVQIREKDTDTAEFLQIAKDSKTICDRYNVPLLINDRIDIALAVKARGVHLGQCDMPVSVARRLLSPSAIIGVSCNTVQDVQKAIQDGADYVGIGAVYGTQTKQLTSPTIGVRGVGSMLAALDGTLVKAVAIGGIKSTNLLRTLHGAVSTTGHALDGVAVVSDIVGSPEPQVVAQKLSRTLSAFNKTHSARSSEEIPSCDLLIDKVIGLMENLKTINPLVHQITNNVVATQSANITLALGASPIMATAPEEMEDLTSVCGAVLINIGTLTLATKEGMLRAGYFANASRKPLILDPVGIGATSFRKNTTNDLLDRWQPSVIKGNAGELSALAGSLEVQSKGVDSVGSGFKDPVAFVKALANKERCIVVLTGPTDYISDGHIVAELSNGDEMLGRITGSGCMVGTAIASYCAAAATSAANDSIDEGKIVQGDMFLGAIAAVLVYTIAAELAVKRESVNGPGTFLAAFIDQIASLTPEEIRILARVKLL